MTKLTQLHFARSHRPDGSTEIALEIDRQIVLEPGTRLRLVSIRSGAVAMTLIVDAPPQPRQEPRP